MNWQADSAVRVSAVRVSMCHLRSYNIFYSNMHPSANRRFSDSSPAILAKIILWSHLALHRSVVFKPVLKAPLSCTFCMSSLSDTPDSTWFKGDLQNVQDRGAFRIGLKTTGLENVKWVNSFLSPSENIIAIHSQALPLMILPRWVVWEVFSRANSKWQSSQRLVPEAMSQRSWQTHGAPSPESQPHSQGDNRSPACCLHDRYDRTAPQSSDWKQKTWVLTINSTTSENNNKITHYYRTLN